MNKFKLVLITSCILSAFSANAQFLGLTVNKEEPKAEAKVENLDDLLSSKISQEAQKKDEVSEMRRQALEDMASALGSTAGLNYRMNEIRKEVDKKALDLDQRFNFANLIIDNGVLPPVLEEGLANFAQNSDDQVRIADKMYKIVSPAKFVSVYPTWRTYLQFSFPSFEKPPAAYLPQNDAEKVIWDKALKEGWNNGETQAQRLFEASLSRLERDYLGMIKYKMLVKQGLITPTIIAKQNFGVTGGGKEMAINDQVFRISDHSALNPNQKDWKVEYPVSNQTNGVLK